jgi:hypothetical protein
MAEVKNSFLQSKMNKDLDDRLIPNGQYRDALNVSIGKSESENVGVLQNILGNTKLNTLSTVDATLNCIGVFMDNQNNRIYQFLTNYTDLNPEDITLCDNITPPIGGWVMKITVYDFNTSPQYTTLVSGTFLNFSTTNLILGVNLVEGLLFWTDNRNQPRKINVSSALNNPLYYTTETQISVAKYAPVDPISMFKKATAVVISIDTDNFVYSFESQTGVLEVGMTLVKSTMPENGYTSIVGFPNEDSFELYTFDNTISEGDTLTFITSTMTDKSSDPDWPGDPSFLEDKYVRFSYRFKFDDNEYSLIAPFTQIAYIPKQKGYFIDGNESSAYKSTVISWMENNVNNIELLVPLPDTGDNIRDSYKITQLEILYKESDALSIKVLDTIDYVAIRQSSPNTNVYNYPYQSQKPFKTLSDDQITRVYDNVPVRALGQEIVGNRVVYGNFYNMYSPPSSINYNTTILSKSSIFNNFIEYPNHTIKQNRNYQVGFVLADKFGRQSSVILSTVDLQSTSVAGTIFGGSTLYAPYEEDSSSNIISVKNWFGNAIVTIVNSTIDSTRDIQAGTPGLYAEPTSAIGFIVLPTTTAITDNSYQFTISSAPGQAVPVIGDRMRGAYTDYVTVVPKKPSDPNPPHPAYFIRTSGRINDVYLSNPDNDVDTKFAYNINEIGWYSYKIVVKQQQQEYYNVYLPGMLDGYPSNQTYGSQVIYTDGVASTQNGINTTDFPVGEIGKTGHIVLINDNINKVPRDLVEVGPDQKLYRSSVSLYGKVENAATLLPLIADEDYLVTNPLETSIVYKIEDNVGILTSVVAGNGIQSDQSNTPADNPKRWYANTAVVSNELYSFDVIIRVLAEVGDTLIALNVPHENIEIDDQVVYEVDGIKYYNSISAGGTTDVTLTTALTTDIPVDTIIKIIRPTHGKITFSPPNFVNNDGTNVYLNYTIAKGENIQYFPTRKADIVTAIATAADFNFLDNNVNNIKGTAGLNFYQLQTKPSIGRVSVVNPIGVISDIMTPYLSVYETTPEISALQLFWETASTGLISDLNYDVSVGYDGPIGFSNINFVFNEDQDKDGSGLNEGEPNSKWITNTFTLLNNTGVPLPFIGNPVLVSVFDNFGTDVTSSFGVSLESPLDPNTIRIFINNSFAFTHTSNIFGNFTFQIRTELTPGQFATFPVYGRLRNIAPYFTETAEDYSVKISVDYPFNSSQDVEFITASNGSFSTGSQSQINLFWSIIEGNSDNYFTLNSSTGLLSLINENIPIGIYTLKVEIQDAYSSGPLFGDPDYFGTLSSEIEFTVTIMPRPVPDSLIYETDEFVWNHDTACSGSNVPGQGYAAFYVGAANIRPNIFGINLGLPDITLTSPPASSRAFQSYVNVGSANGLIFGSSNPPIGLTRGTLEWVISNVGRNMYPNYSSVDTAQKKNAYWNTQRQGDLEYILYYRANSSDSWIPARSDNGFPETLQSTPVWRSIVDLEMSLYHFTWAKLENAVNPNSTSIAIIIPEFQAQPKVNDYIEMQSSIFSIPFTSRITEVNINTNTVGIIIDPPTPPIAGFGAGLNVKIIRVPENSTGEVFKQTSFTTSNPGEYCLVLKYTYKREVDDYVFRRTTDGLGVSDYVNLDPGVAVVVGDNAFWSTNEPFASYSRTVESVTTILTGQRINMNGTNVVIPDNTTITFRRPNPKNLYCSTIDMFGKVQTRDVNYPINPIRYQVASNSISNYPYSTSPLSYLSVITGFDYVINATLIAQTTVSNEIELLSLPIPQYLFVMDGKITPGVYVYTSGYTDWVGDPYFEPNAQVTDFDENTRTITISSSTKVPIPADTKIVLTVRPDAGFGFTGSLWTTSNNGLAITQFYSDENMLLPWQPAYSDGFCVYRNADRDYSEQITDGPVTWSVPPPGNAPYITIMPPITKKPFFTGRFTGNGQSIISTTSGAVDFYTAWNYEQRYPIVGVNVSVLLQCLVDDTSSFLSDVVVGDFVYNLTTGLSTQVTEVISNTVLKLSDNIFTEVGRTYMVSPKLFVNQEPGNLYQVKSY